ncbi:preprotein translocase subunit SecY [Candidatus Micrarchaeota archaeon]|nr:preprotein translocase subunit SecY [Candidatus Micrarchaeota archaeon]
MNLKIFEPIIRLLPEIEVPTQKPVLKQKLIWTGFALLVFAVMGTIVPIGTVETQSGFLQQLQLITASKIGTLATLGIGPVVMGSIILQLLMGAKIINVDINNPEQKKLYHGLQKLVSIAFCFFEGGIYVMSGFVPATPGMFNVAFLIAQLAFGAIILMYLDELVSKYGIGSGIGLFIAAGVSFTIIWQLFAWVAPSGTYVGLVPQLIQGLMTGNIPETAIFPIVFTVLVFCMCVYAESMKIEIPLTFGRIRGYGAKYPIKFFYVSNIPVIFAAALLANVQLFGVALQKIGFPLLGAFGANNQPMDGIAYYLRAPHAAFGTPTNIGVTLASSDILLNILVYAIFMVVLCVVFGKFWVELSNMGPKAVAGQLQQVGLHVPGFRRDPRVIENVLERYIPMITVLGSIAVGMLAVFADLTGALGTGTGILLTVGILYKMYEELATQQAFEMMPALRGLLGEG